MVTQNRIQLKYETRRDFAGASLTTAYQAWGSPLANPARIVKVVNGTNKDLSISTNGVDDMDIVVSSTGAVTDLTAARNHNDGAYFAAGTQFYIKSTAAGTGTAYLVVIYTS